MAAAACRRNRNSSGISFSVRPARRPIRIQAAFWIVFLWLKLETLGANVMLSVGTLVSCCRARPQQSGATQSGGRIDDLGGGRRESRRSAFEA